MISPRSLLHLSYKKFINRILIVSMVMEQYHYELQRLNLPGELGKKGQTKLGKSEFNY